jgi:hypothetical protein
MPLIVKTALILFITLSAMLLSPLTLAAGMWLAGPGAPLAGALVVAAACAVALRTAAALRSPH